jgi:hypothetical protein
MGVLGDLPESPLGVREALKSKDTDGPLQKNGQKPLQTVGA